MVALALVACVDDLAREPSKHETTFGEKFFTVACQRVAYSSSLQQGPPFDVAGDRYRLACKYGAAHVPGDVAARDPKVATLLAGRGEMVAAIDLVFPSAELEGIQGYLGKILPLTDDGRFPALVDRAATVLGMMQAEPEAAAALARLEHRLGYRPRACTMGLVREALRYPRLRPLAMAALRLLVKGGAAHDELMALTAGLGLELRTARRVDDVESREPLRLDASERPLRLALDLLLEEEPTLGGGTPMWLVKRDHRGLAVVNRDPAANVLGGLFVDEDGDGLADMDERGRLRYRNGEAPRPFLLDGSAADSAASRDLHGRGLDGSGRPLYEYVDLDRTVLGALARDALALFDPARSVGLDLLHGAGLMLGSRRPASKADVGAKALSFNGFVSEESPLLDLAYAGLQILRDPNVNETLELVETLLTPGPACSGGAAGCLPRVTAQLVGGAFRASDLGEGHPEAQVPAESTIYDDLIEVLRRVVNTPGLVEDLVKALADPRARQLPRMLVNYFSLRDVHTLDAQGEKVIAAAPCPKNTGAPLWCTPVDRSRPDGTGNRSIQQRLIHIINNTNGMKICNKEGAMVRLPLIGIEIGGPFHACELFEVKNGAVFYAQSMARQRGPAGELTSTPKAHLRLKTENMPAWMSAVVKTVGADYVLELLTGIDGFSEHPSAQAVNRLMFMPVLPDTLAAAIDLPRDIDGHPVVTYHRGSLLSWEVPHPGISCSSSQQPCTFLDAFAPVVQAFADHDAEPMLIDLLSVLHRHWASPNNDRHQLVNPAEPNFSRGSAAVTYEPLLIEVLADGALYDGIVALSKALVSLKLPGGKPALPVLANAAAFLIDPSRTPDLRYRDGRGRSYTSDGKREVAGGVSPFYLFADALTAKDRALAAADGSPAAAAWSNGADGLIDLFFEVEGRGAAARFRNPRITPVARKLVAFLRQRVAVHQGQGDLLRWAGEELPADLERLATSPVTAASVDLIAAVHESPAAVEELNRLLSHLVDELGKPETFTSTVTAVADLLQLALDDLDLLPVAHVIGDALEPQIGLVDAVIGFLEPALTADEDGVLSRVLTNAYREQSPARSPVQTLFDLASEIHRVVPGSGAPYQGQDFLAVFDEARDFLSNQDTGLNSFFDLIKNRCGGPCTLAGQ